MLTGDSKRYLDTFFRKRRDELLKQRETDRKTVRGEAVLENAVKPDCDLMAGLVHAHAEGVQKAYENLGQPLTQQIMTMKSCRKWLQYSQRLPLLFLARNTEWNRYNGEEAQWMRQHPRR